MLDAAISAWLTARTTSQAEDDPAAGSPPAAVAIDGKSLRGTFARTGGAGTLLPAAITHTTGQQHTDGIVLGQRLVPTGTSEIAWFAPLLDQTDLAGKVVTADALHTTREHARYLHRRGAYDVFTVKENQHQLSERLDALPWHEIPTCTPHETDHGRTERRTIQLTPLGRYLGYPTIDFPHATHAFLIERHTTTTAAAAPTPNWASPTCPATTPTPHRSRPMSATTGTSTTACTGSATSPTAKTTPTSAPATHPASWPPCATSPSAPSDTTAGPPSPKAYAT